MAEFAPTRVDHLVIGGQHPYAKSFAGVRQMMQTGITQGGDAFVAAVEQAFGTLTPAYIARLREGDLKAYLAAAQDRTSLESLLPKMTMPCCLYVGESDRQSPFDDVKAASRLIPHARFFSLPTQPPPDHGLLRSCAAACDAVFTGCGLRADIFLCQGPFVASRRSLASLRGSERHHIPDIA